jgi:rubredoxin
MKQIDVPAPAIESPFDYYCPICGIELAKSNFETLDRDYFCPYCSTQQRASRVPARSRW